MIEDFLIYLLGPGISTMLAIFVTMGTCILGVFWIFNKAGLK